VRRAGRADLTDRLLAEKLAREAERPSWRSGFDPAMSKAVALAGGHPGAPGLIPPCRRRRRSPAPS